MSSAVSQGYVSRTSASVAPSMRLNRMSPTVVCVPLTSQLRWADAPGNVLLVARSTGLPRDSVANVSLVLAVNRRQLSERAGVIGELELEQIFLGIDTVLGRV